MCVAFFFLFGNGDRDVAAVIDFMAESFEASFESRDPDSGWPHIDAAAGLAEVERDSDYTDLFAGDVGGRCSSGCHGQELFTAEDAEIAESGNSFTIRLSPFLSTRL